MPSDSSKVSILAGKLSNLSKDIRIQLQFSSILSNLNENFKFLRAPRYFAIISSSAQASSHTHGKLSHSQCAIGMVRYSCAHALNAMQFVGKTQENAVHPHTHTHTAYDPPHVIAAACRISRYMPHQCSHYHRHHHRTVSQPFSRSALVAVRRSLFTHTHTRARAPSSRLFRRVSYATIRNNSCRSVVFRLFARADAQSFFCSRFHVCNTRCFGTVALSLSAAPVQRRSNVAAVQCSVRWLFSAVEAVRGVFDGLCALVRSSLNRTFLCDFTRTGLEYNTEQNEQQPRRTIHEQTYKKKPKTPSNIKLLCLLSLFKWNISKIEDRG